MDHRASIAVFVLHTLPSFFYLFINKFKPKKKTRCSRSLCGFASFSPGFDLYWRVGAPFFLFGFFRFLLLLI